MNLRKWTPIEAEDGDAFGAVVAALAEAIGDESVIAMDAGHFNGWVTRYFPFNPRHIMVRAVPGPMRLAVPAAVAADMRPPGRAGEACMSHGGSRSTAQENDPPGAQR